MVANAPIKWIFILFVFWVGCRERPTRGIAYSELKMGEHVKSSGKKLQANSLGLNTVLIPEAKSDTVFVAVHGYGSRGYEWVYPLRRLSESGHKTFYYRWDWTLCPEEAGRQLKSAIDSLLRHQRAIHHLVIIGHSYGGVIVSQLADEAFRVSVDIHSIAAPLAGHPRLEVNCPDYPEFQNLIITVNHFQWRTRQKQDGAFKDLPIDPQVVNIAGSQVRLLPDTLENGKRLGHNWSITWTVNQLFLSVLD